MEKEQIEKWEFHYLARIAEILASHMEELKEKVGTGLSYLRHIYLPLIISSLQEKAFNPFSEVYEKHVCRILEEEFNKMGMKSIVMGYGSDLVLEAVADKHIIQIDTKTASEDNPSDYLGTIPLGINQFSYPGVITLKTASGTMSDSPVRVWSNLPTRYGEDIQNLTYGVIILYPSYKERMDNIRPDYIKVRNMVIKKTRQSMEKRGVVAAFLESKAKGATKTKEEIIAENLIRAHFIHEMQNEVAKYLELTDREEKLLTGLADLVDNLVDDFRLDDLLPSAIIVLSIPNGDLVGSYDTKGEFVSGKQWGASIRYHYKKGMFKEMKEGMPRVVIAYIHQPRNDLRTLLAEKSNARHIFDTSKKELVPLLPQSLTRFLNRF